MDAVAALVHGPAVTPLMLRVTPTSSGKSRNLTQADFERSAPLLGRSARAEVNEASRNSSYVEAILVDIGR
jgi:hypothetical protein